MRILVADGDTESLSSFEITLSHRGFNVYGTDTGEEAVDLGKMYDYDAIVISETPDMHIDTVIRNLRTARVKTPIVVVSGARGAITNGHDFAVPALDLGADDWMSKPCVLDELAARLNAVIRRANGHAQSVIVIGDLSINLNTRGVTYAGQHIYFTTKEFAMLELFAVRKGTVQSKEQIMNTLYGGMDEPALKIIDVFACKVRKKLTNAGAPPDLIETVWGRGYLIRDKGAETVELPPAVSNPVGSYGGFFEGGRREGAT